MAAGDYRACDVCDAKTFYDANIEDLRYTSTWDSSKEYEDWVIGLGTLCTQCTKTHEVLIVDKSNPNIVIKPSNVSLYK